jgi:hypothetical protein
MSHPRNQPEGSVEDARSDYLAAVAPEAFEIETDRLVFPTGLMLPLTVRAAGMPGLPQRPWSRIRAQDFQTGVPYLYSVSLQRELPDVLRRSLRVRRTIFEGVLLALAEKTGRRPSMAEQHTDIALDETESRVAMGEPVFRAALLAGLFAPTPMAEGLESARRLLESRLRAKRFLTQRLTFIADRALLHFQPGGLNFPGVYEPVLMLDEAVRLFPAPNRSLPLPAEAVWLGSAVRDGRDVFFSPRFGLDVASQQPPHATTLILGEMGSGKTSLMRSILLQRLMQGRKIFSLDPEGENNRLCERLGGRVIPAGLPDDPSRCLLHPLQGETAGELLFAVRFLIGALTGGEAIPNKVNAALHDVVQQFWNEKGGDHIPLSLLVESLQNLPHPSEDVTALLHPFTRGGLLDGFFDRDIPLLDFQLFETGTGDGDTAWWNFDLSGLREENKAIIHALLTWFLYRVISTAEIPVDVFIDESWRLLRSPMFSTLLDELGRRARKRGMGIMLATHLPEDLSANAGALGLASMAFVGRMGPVQAEKFLHGLGIPAEEAETHAETISRLPPHTFYAIPAGGRGSMFAVRIRLPPKWLEIWKKLGAAR